MLTVQIRRNSDGAIRSYVDKYDWDDGWIWTEGNFSCDCNRYLFFARAAGLSEDQVDKDDPNQCGDEAYSIKVTATDGAVLYDEWDDIPGVGQGSG